MTAEQLHMKEAVVPWSTHMRMAPVVEQFGPTAACVMLTKLQPVMLKLGVLST